MPCCHGRPPATRPNNQRLSIDRTQCGECGGLGSWSVARPHRTLDAGANRYSVEKTWPALNLAVMGSPQSPIQHHDHYGPGTIAPHRAVTCIVQCASDSESSCPSIESIFDGWRGTDPVRHDANTRSSVLVQQRELAQGPSPPHGRSGTAAHELPMHARDTETRSYSVGDHDSRRSRGSRRRDEHQLTVDQYGSIVPPVVSFRARAP